MSDLTLPHSYIARTMARLSQLPVMADGSPQAARAAFGAGADLLGPKANLHSVTDVRIPTRMGHVAGRLLLPVSDPSGVIVYVHGGGWAIGGIPDFDTLCRRLAELSRCAVLLPDYRLAPENPFPAGLHDIIDTLAAVLADHFPAIADLPIVVAGDSAGANLASVAIRKMPDTARLQAQILFYPVTDCDFNNESYLAHGMGLPLSRADMQWFFGHYAPSTLWSDPDIAPLRAEDLGRLPQTVIVTAQYDVLAQEGRLYANKLKQCGVETDFTEAAGFAHGFLRQHNFVPEVDAILQAVSGKIGQICATQGRG